VVGGNVDQGKRKLGFCKQGEKNQSTEKRVTPIRKGNSAPWGEKRRLMGEKSGYWQ